MDLTEQLTSYTEHLAKDRDKALAFAEKFATTRGEHLGVAEGYEWALHGLYIFTGGEHGESIDDQPDLVRIRAAYRAAYYHVTPA